MHGLAAPLSRLYRDDLLIAQGLITDLACQPCGVPGIVKDAWPKEGAICDTLAIMDGERRGASRHRVPEGVTAKVSGVAVRLLELSLVGAKVEHQERFVLTSPQLTMTWRTDAITVAVRAARSEIVGRHAALLVYHTGLHFVDLDSATQGFVASILREPESAPLEATTTITPTSRQPDAKAVTEARSGDDSWTRQVHLLRNELDEDLPYAQFRLTSTGWQKDYVASPAQPEDGFTIPRERRDFDELHRAFETADAETRRMMQIALESQLLKAT